ncbi:MAG: thioredoxin family protein [Saprospiraceae bacterium]
MKYFSFLILSVTLLLCSCGGEKPVTAEETPATPPTVTPKAPTPKPKATATAQSGTDIQWMSIEEVQQKVRKEPRKILVDVYTPWCGPCKMMMRSTFKDPNLIEYLNKNYYAVKFNGESGEAITFNGKKFENPNYNPAIPENRRNSQHQFTQSLGLRGYPTLYVFDAELNKVTQSVGMKSAPQLMDVLKKIEG